MTAVLADHAELRVQNRAVVEAFVDPEQRERRLELFAEDGVWRVYFNSSVLFEAFRGRGGRGGIVTGCAGAERVDFGHRVGLYIRIRTRILS